MKERELLEQAARICDMLDAAAGINPKRRADGGSLAELRLMSFIYSSPENATLIEGEDSVARRITLADSREARLTMEPRKVTFDTVRYADGHRETVLNMTERGWGTYKIDPLTGVMTHIANGKEKLIGARGKRTLAKRVGTLTAIV